MRAHTARGAQVAWDVLYLGRNRLAADRAALGARLVEAGFSSCAHAYALSSRGLRRLLALPLARSAIPVDDLLPALYATHPRADVAEWAAAACASAAFAAPTDPSAHTANAGGGGPFVALAFRHDLVWQLEAVATGGEGATWHAPASTLARSDIRPVRRRRSHHHRGGGASAPGVFGAEWPERDCAEAMAGVRAAAGGARPGGAPWLVPSDRACGRAWCELPLWAWVWAAALSGEAGVRALRRVSRGMHAALSEGTVWRCFVLRRQTTAPPPCDDTTTAATTNRWMQLDDRAPLLRFRVSWAASAVDALGGEADADAPAGSVGAPPPSWEEVASACLGGAVLCAERHVSEVRPREVRDAPMALRCEADTLVSTPMLWRSPALLRAYAVRPFQAAPSLSPVATSARDLGVRPRRDLGRWSTRARAATRATRR